MEILMNLGALLLMFLIVWAGFVCNLLIANDFIFPVTYRVVYEKKEWRIKMKYPWFVIPQMQYIKKYQSGPNDIEGDGAMSPIDYGSKDDALQEIKSRLIETEELKKRIKSKWIRSLSDFE